MHIALPMVKMALNPGLKDCICLCNTLMHTVGLFYLHVRFLLQIFEYFVTYLFRFREVNTSELKLKLEKDNEVNVHIKIFMPLGQLESFN